MKKKPFISLILSLGMCVAMLAGCQSAPAAPAKGSSAAASSKAPTSSSSAANTKFDLKAAENVLKKLAAANTNESILKAHKTAEVNSEILYQKTDTVIDANYLDKDQVYLSRVCKGESDEPLENTILTKNNLIYTVEPYEGDRILSLLGDAHADAMQNIIDLSFLEGDLKVKDAEEKDGKYYISFIDEDVKAIKPMAELYEFLATDLTGRESQIVVEKDTLLLLKIDNYFCFGKTLKQYVEASVKYDVETRKIPEKLEKKLKHVPAPVKLVAEDGTTIDALIYEDTGVLLPEKYESSIYLDKEFKQRIDGVVKNKTYYIKNAVE